jgi:hypothetical protein
MKSIQKTSSSQVQNESKEFRSQADTIYLSFFEKPKTMKMVTVETGIDRANICREVSRLKKDSGKIEIVKIDQCRITRHRAGYLTTNPELFPRNNQLKLF